jgi:trehalose-6-phosphate synthase
MDMEVSYRHKWVFFKKKSGIMEFHNLLDRCFRRPEWHEKVVFILKIAPSRTKVGQYRVLKQEIDELVGRINGKGVLILSEMAGAARELGEALVVNSNNKEEVAEALNEALRMPEEEQKSRNEEMQKRLSHYDVFHWGSGFIRSVLETKRLQEELNMKKLSEKIREELKNRKHDFIRGHQRKWGLY